MDPGHVTAKGNAMTEPGPFTPPGGSVPPPPSAAAAPPPLPPPSGAPIGVPPVPSAFPVLPPPPRQRPWLIPVIIGGSLVLAGLIAGGVILAVQLASWVGEMPAANPVAPSVGDELVEGDPGSPVAVDPLECTGCFILSDARSLTLPDESYAAIGLPDNDGTIVDGLTAKEQRDQSGWWADDGGSPDACYFTYTDAPLSFVPGEAEAAEKDDALHYPAWHHDRDEYYLLTQGTRLFDDTAAATTHLAALQSAVDGCPTYSLPATGWAAVVTPAPALTLPDSVAAYGWVEVGGPTRYYAVELQRGNLVTRLALNSDAGGPTEAEFRELVEAYAELLGELEPTG
jgi:hypothetical protein